MKTDLIIKIVKAIISIGGKITVKKETTMPEDNNNNNEQPVKKTTVINSNTIVQFTFKGFISTILTILGIFYGFYKLVIQPDIQQTAEHQKELYQQEHEYMEGEFNEVKNAIQINTKAIQANNERFRDLNESVEDIANSGGSFGSTISAVESTEEIDDSTLAGLNHD